MQLTQIQWEVISRAHAEGPVDPNDVVRFLLHDLDDVLAAIGDLTDRGLMQNAEGAYLLTDEGEAVYKAREKAHSAALKHDTPSWQRG